MRIKSETAIILAKILEDELTHSKIDDIALLLGISPNTHSIASKRKKLSELIKLISDDLHKFLKFLNFALEECNYIDEEKINYMNLELEKYGIKIVKDGKRYTFKAILTNPENSIQNKENKMDYLLPPEIIEKLEQAWELYKEGKFDSIPPACRVALERLASKYNNCGYKDLINTLKSNDKLRETEKTLMNNIYNYLSSFEDNHAGKPPNKDQAYYIINITQYTICYLFNLLEKS